VTIIGGVNGVGKANCLRAGYHETFLPCAAYLLHPNVIAAINQSPRQPLVYTASARVRNVADNAWISIGEASYFQVSLNPDGTVGSADITVKKPETWSPFVAGGTYEDVLRPSNRRLEIRAGLVINGTSYLVVVFSGQVKDYSETHGSNSGSITLRLEDVRDLLERDTATTPTYPAKASYGRSIIAVERAASLAVFAQFLDQAPTSAPAAAQNLLSSITQYVPGEPIISVTSAGGLVVSMTDDGSGETGYSFEYSDSNIISLTRTAGAYQYNVVRCIGLSSGVRTVSEVTDAADIAKRGRIIYGGGLIGSSTQELTVSEATAAQMLANAARGQFAAELPLNPYLRPGMLVKLTSTRMGLSASYGRVGQVNHQYSAGRARTYLNDLVAVPI